MSSDEGGCICGDRDGEGMGTVSSLSFAVNLNCSSKQNETKNSVHKSIRTLSAHSHESGLTLFLQTPSFSASHIRSLQDPGPPAEPVATARGPRTVSPPTSPCAPSGPGGPLGVLLTGEGSTPHGPVGRRRGWRGSSKPSGAWARMWS